MKIGNIEIPRGAGLAPMAGVTDANMRLICADFGCAWAVSEMLSAKGYIYNPGARVHDALLRVMPGEGIKALQFFGSEEYMLTEAIRRLQDSEFDFFDFNMGCPAHKIVTNGEGSALMKEPEKAARLVYAMAMASRKPLTVKIRAGWDSACINAVKVAVMLEESGAAAITVHPRTREMQYSGHSDWSIIAAVKAAVKIPVIGNGDIRSGADALKMLSETGCDAVCVARAAQGNPWIFAEILAALNGEAYTPPTASDRIDIALRHLDMQVEALGQKMGVLEMRKHIAWYLQGLPASGRIRALTNSFTEASEIRSMLEEYRQTLIHTEEE